MALFTIEIQTHDDDTATWQPTGATYNCDPELAGWGSGWTAQHVAGAAADSHHASTPKPFRVVVWEGRDADTSTTPAAAVVETDDIPAAPAAPAMTAQQLADTLIREYADRHRATRCAGEGWGDAVIYAVETAYGFDYQTATEYVAEEAQEALASQD